MNDKNYTKKMPINAMCASILLFISLNVKFFNNIGTDSHEICANYLLYIVISVPKAASAVTLSIRC